MASSERVKELIARQAALMLAKRWRALTKEESRWLQQHRAEMVEAALADDERRTQQRAEADLVCTLSTAAGPRDGRIQNLSLGGARILGPRYFAQLGDLCSIEVALPGQGRLAGTWRARGEERIHREVAPWR